MPKQCLADNCTNPVFSGGYCRNHLYLNPKYQKKASERNKKPKPKPKIFSEKMIADLKVYKVERLKFLGKHPLCEAKLQGCTKQATQVHHKIGRRGKLLLDTNHWLPCCHSCHVFIEQNPEEARKLNLSGHRTGKH